MKRLIITATICAAATGAFARSAPADTTSKDTTHNKGFRITFGKGEDASEVSVNRRKRDTVEYHKSKAPGFSFGLTFARFDLGLTTLLDNGSFKLSDNNNFLRYRSWKSSNVGFDVVQAGYRFSSSFKIYVSGGFDWTLLRLREDITILPNQPTLTFRPDNIDYSKNRFSSSYLRIPLSFDFRSSDNHNGSRYHFVLGPDLGILLNGRVKQISDQNGKQKFNNDYHFAKLRYGAFVRAGHGGAGIFAKYYFNDMFENSPNQKGLKNFAFGFTFGF